MELTRRRFGVAAGAIAVFGASVCVTATRPAPGARCLSATELGVVAALAEAMFPGAPFPLDGLAAGVPAEVDRLLADVLEPIHANGFRALLDALEFGTLASRGARFSALSVEHRLEVLSIWSEVGVFHRRLAADSFKVVLGMAYFGHPAILGHIGWTRGCGGAHS